MYRFRQHVYDRHSLPLQCVRCGQIMKSEVELQHHLQQTDICAKVVFAVDRSDRFGKKQEEAMRSRKGIQKLSEKDKWESMYRVLFGQDCTIPSPCKSVDYPDSLTPSSFSG